MADFDSLREMIARRIKRQRLELEKSEAELSAIDKLTGRDRQSDLVPPVPAKPGR